ncbi:hypothetical protein D9M71_395970 [compost metagenome]
MEEQRRQQDVVAQALGARPEALGKKTAKAQEGTQRYQQDDGEQGGQQQVQHGQHSVVGYVHRLRGRINL